MMRVLVSLLVLGACLLLAPSASAQAPANATENHDTITPDFTGNFYGPLSLGALLVMLLWLAAFLWTAHRQFYLCAVVSWVGIVQPLYVTGFEDVTFVTLVSLFFLFLLLYVVLDWRDARLAAARGDSPRRRTSEP